jgi:hypothetical protein
LRLKIKKDKEINLIKNKKGEGNKPYKKIIMGVLKLANRSHLGWDGFILASSSLVTYTWNT